MNEAAEQRVVGPVAAEGHARLRVLGDVAAELGSGLVARDAAELAGRIAEGRFFVACVGQFKRGKSTLLNALVGRAVLPTGVVPVTAVVTILRHGPGVEAHVTLLDGGRLTVDPATLAEYVSEAGNPGNRKGVAAVEVRLPSPLLERGLCLVDTPGIGSVFASNSETTRAFVPQVDAALVVVGADPPISGDELDLLQQVASGVEHVIVVLNKSDRVSDAESREAAEFALRVIERRIGRDAGPIYRVSAVERAAGAPTRDWDALEARLADLATRSAAVVAAAAERGVARVARDLRREIDERRNALARPIEATERRLESLRRAIADADIALRELAARMRVEHVALAERFDALRAGFLAGEGPAARRDLERVAREAACPRGPACRTAVIDLAHDLARERVTRWIGEIEPQAEALYREAVARFVALANEFATRLAPGGPSDDAPDALARDEFVVERGFREEARFFFTSLLTVAEPGFWAWALDRVRPREAVLRSSVRQAAGYLDRLMATNSARMANDLAARVEESQRRLASEIRGRLSRLVGSAERAAERARASQASGAEAVQAEMARLDGLLALVDGEAGRICFHSETSTFTSQLRQAFARRGLRP